MFERSCGTSAGLELVSCVGFFSELVKGGSMLLVQYCLADSKASRFCVLYKGSKSEQAFLAKRTEEQNSTPRKSVFSRCAAAHACPLRVAR